MMRARQALIVPMLLALACSRPSPESAPDSPADGRKYLLERVDDAAIVQVYADGFAARPLRDKLLMWHLSQAAIAGRDIYYDQRSAAALEMRDTLEAILSHPRDVAPATRRELTRYTKLFWINSGPYEATSARKFLLQLSPEALTDAARAAAAAGATFPTRPGETLDGLLSRLGPMFFDRAVAPSITVKTPPPGQDILTASHNNLYVNVRMSDLEGFRERYSLNSRLVKRDGRLVEEVYRADGRYGPQIREIIRHLTAARAFATPPMARALEALVTWYRTGEAADRRDYDIAWVEDRESPVDTINGFTEVYLDARGVKGAWEAVVFHVNEGKTNAIRALAREAQWFEDRMPWDPKYRKQGVTGITANAIDVVMETGDAGPRTPIGINLPNDQGVREQHGSKSISLSNILEAYDKSSDAAFRTEFAWTPDEAARQERWGALGSELTTNMHEVIGHASGRVSERLQGRPELAIREHFSALEEARADLVALYFIADPKLVELGLVDAASHAEVVRAEYEGYATGVLVQLRRVREGTELEEDHMRNRQLIVHWLLANTPAIERRHRGGKTYHVVVDVKAFRDGVARLLAEVQRIKGEGDYAAAEALFSRYGIRVDPTLRDEIVARVDALNLPSYVAFVMPKLELVNGPDGAIADVKMTYPQDLTTQMLEFGAATRATRQAFLAASPAGAPLGR